MLYNSKQIFIHLPKTGGSTLRKFLKHNLRWSDVEMPVGHRAWWHRPYSLCPKSVAKSRMPIIFVRNPWDFYVSFWAYDSTKFKPKAVGVFSELYGENNSFDFFLNNLLLGNSSTRFRLPQKNELPLVQILKDYDIGMLTYFYFYMSVQNTTRLNLGKLDIFTEKLNVKTYQSEKLNQNFERIFKVNSRIGERFRSFERENVSPRNRNYQVYYNSELENLIRHKERYIIENFNYIF